MIGDFPQPPIEAVMPQTAEVICGVTVGLVVLAFLVAGTAHWRATGSPVGLLLLLGGALAIGNEVIMDELGLAWHHGVGQFTVFQTFGRPIPAWVLCAHTAYFGGLSWVFVRYLQSGPSRAHVWKAVGAVFALNTVLELPILAANVYSYYGNPPFAIGGFPVYFLFVNGGGVLLTAVILTKMPEFFVGRRRWGIPILPIGAQLASTGIIGMPVFSAVNTNLPAAVLWGAGAITLVLGVVVFDFLIRFVCDPSGAEDARRGQVATARMLDSW